MTNCRVLLVAVATIGLPGGSPSYAENLPTCGPPPYQNECPIGRPASIRKFVLAIQPGLFDTGANLPATGLSAMGSAGRTSAGRSAR